MENWYPELGRFGDLDPPNSGFGHGIGITFAAVPGGFYGDLNANFQIQVAHGRGTAPGCGFGDGCGADHPTIDVPYPEPINYPAPKPKLSRRIRGWIKKLLAGYE